MSNLLCRLGKLPRLVSFPFKLDTVGWVTNQALSQGMYLPDNFVCISFYLKKYNSAIKDDYIKFSFLPVNTFTGGKDVPLHDEIFFCYKPDVTEALCKLFGTREKMIFYGVPFNEHIQKIIKEIRQRLDCYEELGVVDELETLAIHLFSSILKALRQEKNKGQVPNMDIFEIAEGLKNGQELNSLIRKYGFSRRNFYIQWNNVFNLSPVNFKLNEQLSNAADMLTGTDLSIKEISEASGFSNLVYFYKRFRQKYGKTPAVFRAEMFSMSGV